ncbi:MAG TPA: hypothetical protein VK806_13205 [Bacteroidia bacterium]|jgi:hypothetical protein|nr:hypothetical protein [Bacteroidia bacterium]
MHQTLKKYTYILALVFGLVFCGNLHAQDILSQMQTGKDVDVRFTDQAMGGGFLHSQGWGLFFRRAKIKSIFKKYFWEIETATMHNPKEYKISNQNYPDASGYYFGKLNGVQMFRAGFGCNRMVWRKNDERCVEIDAVYAAGLSLAVTKPVYLEIIESTPNPEEFILSTEKYNPNTDNPGNIYGRASIFDGLGELSVYPGGYGRLGLNFDYANRHNTVKAIEVGAELDLYPKVIPIMAFNPNSQYFLNLYISFSIGKRWF